jgi:DNA-binding NtrC family response regulator
VQHYTSAEEAGGKPFATPMTLSSAPGPLEAAAPKLNGVRILVVEDCWHIGSAVKSLLQACGADVAGPVATTAAAEHLICEQTPDVALVDFCLRGGERADVLIDQLHDRDVQVIVITGYAALAPSKAVAILQKPIDEAQLLACLRAVTAQKSMR